MWVKGQLVPSVQIKESVSQLLSWLQQFEKKVICAHNGRRFDFPFFVITEEAGQIFPFL
jgi:uncharacterized protein YprB with RNaseH-like and TPR domain